MLLRAGLFWLLLAGFVQGQEARRWHGLSPFDIQGFVAAEKTAERLLRAGRVAQAIAAYDQMLARFPQVPRLRINRGVALVLARREEEAVQAFEAGAAMGFAKFEQFNAPQLKSFMARPEIKKLAAAAKPGEPEVIFPPAIPAKASAGQILITDANVDYLPKSDTLLIRTKFPKRKYSRAVSTSKEPWATRINRLHGRGKAAGNHGDIYENRDNGHSMFDLKEFPQFTQMQYAPELAKYNLSGGPSLNLVADAVVMGNSSTAFSSGPYWRSLIRHVMTSADQPGKLFNQHRANQIYVYPEVRDFDSLADYFPGYFATQLMSVGVSGSDRPVMRAVALALAAFRPDVKAELKRRNLIAPSVAMILRGAIAGVKARDGMSDLGHRSAIEGDKIDLMRVIDLAQSYQLDALPPRVVMAVESEAPRLDPGRNSFTPLNSEAVYATPTSHARIARGTFQTRTYRLAALVQDAKPERFEWRVLAGDASRIVITPLDPRAERVEVSIPWHDPFTTAEGDVQARVDIGVSTKAGGLWSSPAVFSLTFPSKETRRYGPAGQILVVDYNDPEKARVYADPKLYFRIDWRDEYIYRDGKPEGWTRHLWGAEKRYASTGDIVTRLDQEGRPIEGVVPHYEIRQLENGVRQVWVEPGTAKVGWQYAGPEDRIGLRVPKP